MIDDASLTKRRFLLCEGSMQKKLPWILISFGVFLLGAALVTLLVVAILAFIGNNDEVVEHDDETPPTSTPIVVGERVSPTFIHSTLPPVTPTWTFTFEPPSPLPPSATASLTRTATATSTPSVTSTPSRTSTASLSPTVTATTTITLTPSHTARPPGPTVAYPDGLPMRLYYDDYSFYMWNPNGIDIPVSSLSFEALDANGIPSGKIFRGTSWAEFYHAIESGKCTAIETTLAPALLRPSQCHDYNAIITPQRTSRMVFWIDGPMFRVIWEQDEVARCRSVASECVIFLP